MHKVQETLIFGRNYLKEKGIISYDIDAKVLLMFILNIDKVTLLTSNFDIDIDTYNKYLDVLTRRANSEPVAYIVNYQEFMALPFYVDDNVLIPRGDTEILVEEAIELIKEHKFTTMLDLCTGTGAIAISTVHYTGINATASDISPKCIEIATRNAKTNNLLDKIEFIESDLFTNINKKFDIIASNPPYISIDEMQDLMKDVVDYEPRLALTDEGDGLKFYKEIIKSSRDYLNDNGYILLEIGYNQKDDVEKILLQNGYNSVKVLMDLNGHNRVLCARK